MEHVVLVNRLDHPVGTMEKMKAHREGKLHRAFSVFVFNRKGELLLQQRAHTKYHSGGLWTNTCCSHPRPGEDIEHAAKRRLREEMGFECDLFHAFSFIYKKHLDQGMIEHELDHVWIGSYNGPFRINTDEVAATRFVSPEKIRNEIALSPATFTEWFRICFEQVEKFRSRQICQSLAI
ncbi:MAG: isopentenyl-diphosphate Delta-isomerase [Flavobacteriales bacterium]|nr:isopentenyl-diphosphate Delta-isomerase [Flavobacteriales bacterium]MCB9448564.1 isopentenyl-diphosphate Delta-isomerase [Flavobacteriales bacterium]